MRQYNSAYAREPQFETRSRQKEAFLENLERNNNFG